MAHVTLFNPGVYLISGFRWSFYGQSDGNVVWSFSIIVAIMVACLVAIAWMIRTGWRLKN